MTDLAVYLNNLLLVRSTFKFYHWSTSVYARHVASCGLVAAMDTFIDKLAETAITRYGRPPAAMRLAAEGFAIPSDAAAVEMLQNLSTQISRNFPFKDADLVNLRDDFVATLNHTLYLFTLK